LQRFACDVQVEDCGVSKKNKIKVPKKLAGVRIPKVVRQIANDVLSHPMGRVVVAEALVDATSGFIRNQAQQGSVTRKVVAHPIESAQSISHAAQSVGHAGANAASAIGTASSGVVGLMARAIEGLLSYLQSELPAAPIRHRTPKQKRKAERRRSRRSENGRFAESRSTH
jgi:hypothetical protein